MSEAIRYGEEIQYEGDLREFADRLLETARVEYVEEGVLLVKNPPGFQHRTIVRMMVRAILAATLTASEALDWATNENYQWGICPMPAADSMCRI
ncbi:hypothetical protein [Nocardia thraciensis]